MSPYIKLACAGLLPVIASVFLYMLDSRTSFSKLNYWVKQAIFGVVFGIIAVFGTEYGVKIHGVTMNVRDAAPICAGLIFGAPAGIISGLIGGIERFIAAAWGAGEYTKIACSVSTVFAGCFSAWLRKYMFDDKKPAWFYGLAAGLICEVLHMLMVFITNINDAQNAFIVVQSCAIPMIISNGLSVMLAIILIAWLARENFRQPQEKVSITQTFQRRLLICVIVAFLFTSTFTFIVQSGVSKGQTDNLLRLNISDVKDDIADASDENLLKIARTVASEINSMDEVIDVRVLGKLSREMDIAEINVIDTRGMISASTNISFVKYEMVANEQSAEFLAINDGEVTEMVQEYQPNAVDSVMRKYAGVALERGGFVQVAYDTAHFHADIAEEVVGATRNRHVGETGNIIICDEYFNIVSDRNGCEGENLDVTGLYIDRENMLPNVRYNATIYGSEAAWMYDTTEGYYIIGVYPMEEAALARDLSLYITCFMEVLIFTALFILVYFLIKKLIVDNIRKINSSLARITSGDLDTTVDVRSNEEFASLSDDINSTVVTLKHYIDEAAARIDKELEFAKTIQSSALPSVFPPYPNRHEFDIWAGMKTAKEVGGDFYDFYLLGEDKLAFLIADVSGKGIPAAMFMMTSKTMLKNLAETGTDVNDVFTRTNEQLCASNEAGMFVTAWMGILDLRTGIVSFANAGHNPPLVKHRDGSFEYLRSRAGFVLAGMEGISYRKNELQLEPGDIIYLYTDGVTEATDSNNELYGEQRLLDRLNAIEDTDMETVCRTVKADVDEFVGEAPQFDDITMLGLKFIEPMDGRAKQ